MSADTRIVFPADKAGQVIGFPYFLRLLGLLGVQPHFSCTNFQFGVSKPEMNNLQVANFPSELCGLGPTHAFIVIRGWITTSRTTLPREGNAAASLKTDRVSRIRRPAPEEHCHALAR